MCKILSYEFVNKKDLEKFLGLAGSGIVYTIPYVTFVQASMKDHARLINTLDAEGISVSNRELVGSADPRAYLFGEDDAELVSVSWY